MTTTDELGIDVRRPHPGINIALRAGLVALAEYLTDQDEYTDPWSLFAAFVPWQTDMAAVEGAASDLLRLVTLRASWPARYNPFDLEVALDYLTGVR